MIKTRRFDNDNPSPPVLFTILQVLLMSGMALGGAFAFWIHGNHFPALVFAAGCGFFIFIMIRNVRRYISAIEVGKNAITVYFRGSRLESNPRLVQAKNPWYAALMDKGAIEIKPNAYHVSQCHIAP